MMEFLLLAKEGQWSLLPVGGGRYFFTDPSSYAFHFCAIGSEELTNGTYFLLMT